MTPFPLRRPRRTRRTPALRAMVAEARLSPADLIWPLFLTAGAAPEPVPSLPGVARLTLEGAVAAAEDARALGIPCVALFPATPPALKTRDCAEAWNPDNLVNTATRAIKDRVPEVAVMLDVALDPYNPDGHDGFVIGGAVENDTTLDALERQALAQAEAGADILGPSDMMDGRVGRIRDALEREGFAATAIMSYAAKYASAYYGPFRDAVGASGALKGDKTTYQLDPANGREGVEELRAAVAQGADMVMVKPGMPYLDIVRRARDAVGVPVFAYQVSGEYAMISAAGQNGWLDREAAMMEALMAFKRAGADGVLSYFAPEAARLMG